MEVMDALNTLAPDHPIEKFSVDSVVGEGARMFVPASEAARLLRVTPVRVKHALRHDRLVGKKKGRDWWVDTENLLEVLNAGGWHSLNIRPGPKND